MPPPFPPPSQRAHHDHGRLRILHVDSEMNWRGGQEQLRLLTRGLQSYNVESHVLAQPKSAVADRLKLFVPTHQVRMLNDLDFFAAYKLARLCHTHHFQIVHAHTPRAHMLAILAKKLLPSLRIVVHRRVAFLPNKNGISGKKYRTKSINSWIAISAVVRDILIATGVPENKITVIRDAAEDGLFAEFDADKALQRLSARYQFPEKTPLLVQVANLSPEKGHSVFLEAMALLKAQGHSFHTLFTGEGREREILEYQAQKLGVQDRLTFTGFVAQPAHIIGVASVFVMPSLSEGLGSSILMSFQAGVPVVASDAGGIPELVVHGQTGLLTPAGDPSALARAIGDVLSRPEWARQLGAGGQKYFLEKGRPDRMVKETWELYLKVMDKKNG